MYTCWWKSLLYLYCCSPTLKQLWNRWRLVNWEQEEDHCIIQSCTETISRTRCLQTIRLPMKTQWRFSVSSREKGRGSIGLMKIWVDRWSSCSRQRTRAPIVLPNLHQSVVRSECRPQKWSEPTTGLRSVILSFRRVLAPVGQWIPGSVHFPGAPSLSILIFVM